MNEYREIIETENGFIDGVGAVISGRPIVKKPTDGD